MSSTPNKEQVNHGSVGRIDRVRMLPMSLAEEFFEGRLLDGMADLASPFATELIGAVRQHIGPHYQVPAFPRVRWLHATGVSQARVRQIATEFVSCLQSGSYRMLTYTMDVEEFLWALGYGEQAVGLLGAYARDRSAVPRELHDRMMRHVREYLAVGGMPATVRAFAPERDFGAARDVQLNLHALYLDDIARYAPPEERVKARACYLSLPHQLAKENTKFQYAVVEKRAGARKYASSIGWLVGSEMVLVCRAVSTPTYPLAAYEDDSRFRLYAHGTGMLMAMYDFGMMRAVVEDELAGPMKGGLYENLTAVTLAANDVPLRYWMSAGGNREIEFLGERDARVEPVEVKASRGSTVSLNALLERDDIVRGYKLAGGNVGQDGKKDTLPHYLAMYLYR